MVSITQLPGRPLRPKEIATLDEETRLSIVSYGGIPGDDGVRVYAVKVVGDETAHALGFDDSRDQWRKLASAGTADLAAADERLDGVLDEWVQDRYGDQFEVLKTVR